MVQSDVRTLPDRSICHDQSVKLVLQAVSINQSMDEFQPSTTEERTPDYQASRHPPHCRRCHDDAP